MLVSNWLVPLAVPLLLAGCATTTPTFVTDTACLAFEPIRYSRQDTPKTQSQIRAHNAAWDALCKDK